MLLGAGVRAMDAGLTCPDWPLCFSKVIPEYHFGVYLEFIHRAIAGLLFLIYAAVFGYCLWKPALKSFRPLMGFGFLILVTQVIMGALTVLKVLQAGIVTAHLSLAAIFLLTLTALRWKVRLQDSSYVLKTQETSSSYKGILLVTFVLVSAQMILGGLVASNYAGMACVDFPTCNGQWLPTFSGPIGLQVLHRLGAYAITAVILFLFFKTRALKDPSYRNLSHRLLFFISLQVIVGIMNVKMLIPAWLTVMHLGLGLGVLLTVFQMVLLSRSEKS